MKGPRSSRAGILVALLLHLGLLVMVWQVGSSRPATPQALPISVALLSEAAPAAPAPPSPRPTEPAQPQPRPPRPAPAREQPTPTRSEQPSPQPASDAPTAPAQASAPPSAGSDAPATSGDGPATVAPRFDAAYLHNPRPPYPLLARRRGTEGKVVLKVWVTPTGQAESVSLHQGSGDASLDESALSTVRTWRFVPARRGDQAVAATVLVPILFKLEN